MAEGKITQSERSNYRSSFGATLLFSGVQIYQIIIRIVRSKFIALFIGPLGMGITSLLRSTTDLISASTNLGLKTSGVKTVASAKAEGDMERISKTITVLRRLILLTGLVGAAICAFFSPVWSKISFGNNDYMWSFVFVSVIILIDQLNNGELVLLQGMQQRRMLAKANIIGQTIGLVVTIPLYYFYGVAAIVWVLVLSSVITFCVSRSFTRKLIIPKAKISWRETFDIGREMIKLGIFLSLQYLFAQASLYIIRNFISNWGTLDDVGLYGAGTSIVDGYLGLIFTAMATDYFPRLAATHSNNEMNAAVKGQAEISMLLFAPIVVAFLVFLKPIIVLLYSNKFLPIEGMMYAAMSATIIKALAWSLSYTILAKGKPSYFFLNELISMLYSVPIKLLAYKYWGLTGFGYAIVFTYILYLIQLIIVTKKLFGTTVGKTEWTICAVSCLCICMALFAKVLCPVLIGYIVGSVLLIGTAIYSYVELNKRMDITDIVKKKVISKKQTTI